MSYKHYEGYFSSSDDQTKLYYRYLAATKAKKNYNLIIHHGYGEHSGRYQNVFDILRGEGINIYAMDARGHGKSEGLRGHAQSIGQMATDLHSFILFIKREYKVNQPILLAHSMGGLVALKFCLQDLNNQKLIKALVANGSALKVHLNALLRIKLMIGRLLKSLAPKLRLPAGLNLKSISHDQNVIEAYKTDPLVHDRMSTSLGLSIVDSGTWVLANAASITLPLFLTHGQADGLIPESGTRELFEIVSSKKKTLKIYPDSFHEIYNEDLSRREEPLKDVRTWLLKTFKSF